MPNHRTEVEGDIRQVLGLNRPSTSRKRGKFLAATVVVLTLIAAAVMFFTADYGTTILFKTTTVQRGDLTVLVNATGTLEPVNQVDVGTEVSGTIKTVQVDYNHRVEAGQVLATLDTEQREAKLRQSQAVLALAHAKVQEAQATVTETRNTLLRTRALAQKGLCPQTECEAAEAAYARADAALASAKAQVIQAQAQLDSDRTALDKAVIRAPIQGIVLKRQVEPGQTVVASLQAPVLFVLAESLAHMALHVAVDEADIGQVHEGQHATFTVDAYAERTFPAVITQVRFAPQTVAGVVTYETVLAVENTDLALRPGMTATADIIVNRVVNAMLVPNAALRFTPPLAAEPTGTPGGGLLSRLLPRPPASRTSPEQRQDRESSRQQRVWILRHGVPVALPVTIGATNGRMTEVLAGELAMGMAVIVDVVGPRS